MAKISASFNPEYCTGSCAEARRAQRQLMQAQSRVRDAQDNVDAVNRSMARVRQGTPQAAAGKTRTRTRSGLVSLMPNMVMK